MTLEPKPSLSIKSSIADRLSRLATLAWLPALLISIASLIVSGVSLSYTASNYHLQISGQKADLEISDIKIANPYDKASLFFDLRNEGKLPSGIASLRFSSFLPDGTAKVLIAPVYNASPI